jgi:hypothetical protein
LAQLGQTTAIGRAIGASYTGFVPPKTYASCENRLNPAAEHILTKRRIDWVAITVSSSSPLYCNKLKHRLVFHNATRNSAPANQGTRGRTGDADFDAVGKRSRQTVATPISGHLHGRSCSRSSNTILRITKRDPARSLRWSIGGAARSFHIRKENTYCDILEIEDFRRLKFLSVDRGGNDDLGTCVERRDVEATRGAGELWSPRPKSD